MKRLVSTVCLSLFLAAALLGCKSACDDLEDVCRSCSGDDRESCMDDHDVCDILPGRSGNECCEALASGWEYSCE